jgi:hypothetical protein
MAFLARTVFQGPHLVTNVEVEAMAFHSIPADAVSVADDVKQKFDNAIT